MFVLVVVKLNTHEYILRAFDAVIVAVDVRQILLPQKFGLNL